MISIGICDDEETQIERLARLVNRHPRRGEFDVFSASSPEAFLELARGRAYGISFLDIDMAGMNGIALGEALRRELPGTVIVYVTGHGEYALEAFRVRAFHYLLKPVSEEALLGALNEALRAMEERGEAPCAFTVRKKGEMVSLPYDSILFFEKVGHKIQAVTADGIVDFYGNFSSLLRELPERRFLQCHQGYVAHIGHVRAYRDRMLCFDGGRQIPVSRTFAESVREALAQRLFAGKAAK